MANNAHKIARQVAYNLLSTGSTILKYILRVDDDNGDLQLEPLQIRERYFDVVCENLPESVPVYTIPPPQDQTPPLYIVVNQGVSREAGTKAQFGQTGQLDVIVIERQTTTSGSLSNIDIVVDDIIFALKPNVNFVPLSPAGSNIYIWYIESIDTGIAPIPQGRNIFTAIRLTYTVEFESINN